MEIEIVRKVLQSKPKVILLMELSGFHRRGVRALELNINLSLPMEGKYEGNERG
jgi:hypothetical protein